MELVYRSPLSRGALVVLSVALAVPLTRLLSPLEQTPYALFFVAVVVSAWYGGSWAGLLATALSALALDLFFLHPLYALGTDVADGVRLGAFVAAGALTGLVQATRERREDGLRRRERRRDESLAVVAHELRNFLAPVDAAVRALQGHDIQGPAAERCLEIIERQARHMGRLVNDLIDAARLRQGKLRLCWEPIDLAAVVARAAEAARPLVERRGHRLTVHMPAEPLWLEADATRVEQIVLNLLTNAAKFSARGGEVDVTVERAAGEAVLRVRDRGAGIPADQLARVFDLFGQVEDGAGDGLGVGLSLVRGLARLHGGDAVALSEGPGKGSEFVVRLPLRGN